MRASDAEDGGELVTEVMRGLPAKTHRRGELLIRLSASAVNPELGRGDVKTKPDIGDRFPFQTPDKGSAEVLQGAVFLLGARLEPALYCRFQVRFLNLRNEVVLVSWFRHQVPRASTPGVESNFFLPLSRLSPTLSLQCVFQRGLHVGGNQLRDDVESELAARRGFTPVPKPDCL